MAIYGFTASTCGQTFSDLTSLYQKEINSLKEVQKKRCEICGLAGLMKEEKKNSSRTMLWTPGNLWEWEPS